MSNLPEVYQQGYMHDTYMRSVNPTADTSSRTDIPMAQTENQTKRSTLISMVSVLAKMKTGILLNKSETSFLKGSNARLYVKSMAIRKQVRRLEDKLRNAKSRKEISDIYDDEIGDSALDDGSISAVLPAEELNSMLNMALNNTYRTFLQSAEYAALPKDNRFAETGLTFSARA